MDIFISLGCFGSRVFVYRPLAQLGSMKLTGAKRIPQDKAWKGGLLSSTERRVKATGPMDARPPQSSGINDAAYPRLTQETRTRPVLPGTHLLVVEHKVLERP